MANKYYGATAVAALIAASTKIENVAEAAFNFAKQLAQKLRDAANADGVDTSDSDSAIMSLVAELEAKAGDISDGIIANTPAEADPQPQPGSGGTSGTGGTTQDPSTGDAQQGTVQTGNLSADKGAAQV